MASEKRKTLLRAARAAAKIFYRRHMAVRIAVDCLALDTSSKRAQRALDVHAKLEASREAYDALRAILNSLMLCRG